MGYVHTLYVLTYIIAFFSLIRIQHGLGQFSLDKIPSYYLLYEPDCHCLKVILTQPTGTLDPSAQIRAFKLFLDLMIHLEESIHSVMDLYIPSAQRPVLHVGCPLCDATNPHLRLGSSDRISLDLPPICCAEKGDAEELPRLSYLPFSDTLTHKEFSKWLIT